jgi:hypothetical protein
LQETSVKNAIEQAAKNLCALAGHSEHELINGQPRWRDYLVQVCTVLKAIRAPSETLLDAGMCSAEQWEAMIDSALEECARCEGYP